MRSPDLPRWRVALLAAAVVVPVAWTAPLAVAVETDPYCGLSLTVGATTLPEQGALDLSLEYCQKAGYDGFTWVAAFLCCPWSELGKNGTFLDTEVTNQSANAWVNFTINVGAPGVHDLQVLVRFGLPPDPATSSYDGSESALLTVVGNPTTPNLHETHLGGGWLSHGHPMWTWESVAQSGQILQYEVAPSWGPGPPPSATNFLHPELASGVHSIRVRAQNNVQVWSDWSAPVPAKVDLLVPSSSSLLGGTLRNGWYVGDVSVKLTAQDAHSGVTSILWSLDGSNFTDYVSNVTVRGDGIHRFGHKSLDLAGNQEPVLAFDVHIDTRGPTTLIGLSGNLSSGFYTNPVSVISACVDPPVGSGCALREHSFDNANWTGGNQTTITTDGNHTVYFRSYDVAENRGATTSRFLRVDQSPPILSVDLVGNQNVSGWWNTTVNITLGCKDDTAGVAENGLRFRIGSVDNGNETVYSETVRLRKDGEHLLEVVCVDNAGNEARASSLVRIDTTRPMVGLRSPGYSNGTINVTYNATDGLSGFGGYLDIQEQTMFGFPFIGSNFTTEKQVPIAGRQAVGEVVFDRDVGFYCFRGLVADLAGNQAGVDDQVPACTLRGAGVG